MFYFYCEDKLEARGYKKTLARSGGGLYTAAVYRDLCSGKRRTYVLKNLVEVQLAY